MLYLLKMLNGDVMGFSSSWFDPIINKHRVNLSLVIDRVNDVSFDFTRLVYADMVKSWPDGRACMCGDGFTLPMDDGRIFVGIGCADVVDYVSPMQVVGMCVAWKHEMEHVRQLTHSCFHRDSADTHVALEWLSSLSNPHLYASNYGRLVIELEAHQAGYEHGVDMALGLLNEIGFECTRQDVSEAVLHLVDLYRNSNQTGVLSPFSTRDSFGSVEDVCCVLGERASCVRHGVSMVTSAIYDKGPVLIAGHYNSDAVGSYLLSGLASDTFKSIVLSSTDNRDVLRCVAAHSSWEHPDFRRVIPILSKSDFAIGEYNPYEDVQRRQLMSHLSLFPEFGRYMSLLAQNEGKHHIITDDPMLPGIF